LADSAYAGNSVSNTYATPNSHVFSHREFFRAKFAKMAAAIRAGGAGRAVPIAVRHRQLPIRSNGLNDLPSINSGPEPAEGNFLNGLNA
jgi:hypothetical protein